jgi:hypothetical protein
VRQLGGPDAWNGACGMQGTNPNCATKGLLDLNSPDYDFGRELQWAHLLLLLSRHTVCLVLLDYTIMTLVVPKPCRSRSCMHTRSRQLNEFTQQAEAMSAS